jgi:hypothetical protein
VKAMQDWEMLSLDTTVLRAHGTNKFAIPFVALQLS